MMTPALLPGYTARIHSQSLQPALVQSDDPQAYVQGMLIFGLPKSLRRLIHAAVDIEGGFSSSKIVVFCRGLEAVRAILESAGDSLTVGWDVILESLDLAFVSAPGD